MNDTSRDLFVSASDGLRLYARDQGPLVPGLLPVVCLPGLARTSDDFVHVARALATDAARPRRVLSLDYRGRGRSAWDPDWRRYDVRVELEDVLQVLVAAGIEAAVFIGTSRGGLIAMGLGAIRPAVLRGVVLNDVGPVIDPRGLERIRGYVGNLPLPRDYREAGQILRKISDSQFPRWGDTEWEAVARGTWREGPDGLVLAYDPKLMNTLAGLNSNAPPPELWSLFQALIHVPVLALRGANSDILSAETLNRMERAHPRLEAVTVPDQGHAPALEAEVAERIAGFVEAVELSHRVTGSKT